MGASCSGLKSVSHRQSPRRNSADRLGTKSSRIGSSKREKPPAVLAVAGAGASRARPANRSHMVASLRSRAVGDQSRPHLSNLPLPAVVGEGDKESRSLQTVTRFGEVTLDPHGSCQTVSYDRQEEIYFVVDGGGTLQYEDQAQPLRKHDFMYLPPGSEAFTFQQYGPAAARARHGV